MKLIMTKGLPASGKTTWAKQQVKLGRTKRVNKDDYREMVDGGMWSTKNEKIILELRDDAIVKFLQKGFDVIVDDTNFAPRHEIRLRQLAEEHGAEFEIKDFTDVPVDECIRRDLLRQKSVGADVIKSMYKSYLTPKPNVAQYAEWNDDLPACLIVDIDGTLAHMVDRGPFEYDKVANDVVDERVRDVIHRYRMTGPASDLPDTYIVIVSGREDICKQQTEQWLKDNSIPYDEIFMRKANDHRKDSIIKQEIYDEFIKPRYNVRFVLDDRDQVVKMWRENGLKVLQVAEGGF